MVLFYSELIKKENSIFSNGKLLKNLEIEIHLRKIKENFEIYLKLNERNRKMIVKKNL